MQVLQVVALHQQTGLAEQAMLDQLPGRVNLVQQHVRVDLLGGREDHHLEALAHCLQEVVQIWPLAHIDLVHLSIETVRQGISTYSLVMQSIDGVLNTHIYRYRLSCAYIGMRIYRYGSYV